MAFPIYIQPDQLYCGPTCLKMIAKYYGKQFPITELAKLSYTDKEGSNLLGLSLASEKLGFNTKGVKLSVDTLILTTSLPCIAYWRQNHFVVIHNISKNSIYVADPAKGLLKYSISDFQKCWATEENGEGIVLLMEKTERFDKLNLAEEESSNWINFKMLWPYIKQQKSGLLKLLLSVLIISLLQMAIPIITQAIVDKGINNKDVSFIYLMLFAQLMVFVGRSTFEIVRNFITIKLSTKLNISMLRDFFIKLMRQPIAYFDRKVVGDIIQRIYDNHRIETFLTQSVINSVFSVTTLLVFSVLLATYNIEIFFVFLIGIILYVSWVLFFMARRAKLDYQRFQQGSQNHSNVVELIHGMQEIKLHNAEELKRQEWENLQRKLFDINLKGLSLSTAQSSGSLLINELKNIFITFIVANLVINNQVTFGMMLSVSYIIGQLNTPMIDIVNFVRYWQDAKLSLQRLAEIYNKEPEDNKITTNITINPGSSLILNNVSFKYTDYTEKNVLQNINCVIPANKITAIVGTSGSGKTTLLKLLLKYYLPHTGNITVDDYNLEEISNSYWRTKTGVVMQDGYIFSDTIAKNIAVGDENINYPKLYKAAETANIHTFIENLPYQYETKIGTDGHGISIGQRQRILIARAVYKNPSYIFLDEATSALDANNEKTIMQNLNTFFNNKTVVIIAHRLSTVKNADQILVLHEGGIIEVGSHTELTAKQGLYYELVKNQLELGQ